MGLTDAPDGVLTASPDHAVGAEHPNGDSAYSTIFQRLAPESDDIVGLVAYGLYKQSKRDWVIRHQKQHGEKPDDIERQRFHDHFSDDDLQRFRSEAEARLVDFAEAYFQSLYVHRILKISGLRRGGFGGR